MSGTTSDNEWQWVRTSGTTSDSEWLRVTTYDNEWQRVIQQVTINGNEWQRVTAVVQQMKTTIQKMDDCHPFNDKIRFTTTSRDGWQQLDSLNK